VHVVSGSVVLCVYVMYQGLCACLFVTEQFKLDILCVETRYDRAVHITDKHCVLIPIMAEQCILQIER
jgi:hypothetical protein